MVSLSPSVYSSSGGVVEESLVLSSDFTRGSCSEGGRVGLLLDLDLDGVVRDGGG